MSLSRGPRLILSPYCPYMLQLYTACLHTYYLSVVEFVGLKCIKYLYGLFVISIRKCNYSTNTTRISIQDENHEEEFGSC